MTQRQTLGPPIVISDADELRKQIEYVIKRLLTHSGQNPSFVAEVFAWSGQIAREVVAVLQEKTSQT